MARASVKSPDAFRTISEAADALDLPQHVLRFWETRFSQIKPMKRSGGRRYYRPSDIALLQGIRHLLYDEGYTIKGVQRILREQGIAHVTSMGEGLSARQEAPSTIAPQSPTAIPTQHPSASMQPKPDPVRAALTPAAIEPPSSWAPMTAEPLAPAATVPQMAPPPSQHLAQPPSPSLQFVAEPTPEAVPYAPPTPVAQPHSEPAPQTIAQGSHPQVAPELVLAAEPGKLCFEQTEALATALRTLMDCKAMLDQAKSTLQNPTSSPTSDTEG